MSAAYCRIAPGHLIHALYHDTEYGFPSDDENVLFERLVLEINQAGLSWVTILKKRSAFRAALAEFEVDRVAAFGPSDIDRLLADSGIVRNRLKIEATIENAKRVQALRRSHGSFSGWLEMHHPRSAAEWTRVFRQTFRFTGGQIVNEFLLSLGYLPGAHEPECPVFARILEHSPPWARVPASTGI
jgi:DNA-3-methyladenine glycosylase I